MIGRISIVKLSTVGESIQFKGRIGRSQCNDGRDLTLGQYYMIDSRTGSHLANECDRASKEWSEKKEAQEFTEPCDYCKYKELCQ